jgi:hypothetical protein
MCLHLYLTAPLSQWNTLAANDAGIETSLMYYIGQGVKYLFYPCGFYGDDG